MSRIWTTWARSRQPAAAGVRPALERWTGLADPRSYDAIGRVEGALARYAEEVFEALPEPQQPAAQRIFVQLVQPGEGTEDTRRVASRAELGDENWRLVQHLADKRLIVTGRDAAGQETVEVVHEALILGSGARLDRRDGLPRWQEAASRHAPVAGQRPTRGAARAAVRRDAGRTRRRTQPGRRTSSRQRRSPRAARRERAAHDYRGWRVPASP
ncbi:MAG: hypothetical protein R2844_15070 [Caldilineales bacterium]